LLQLSECHAGVAKQSELNGKANAIGIAAADRHQVLIGPGQGEATRHAVWIDRDAEECVALIVGQQLSVRHLCPPVDGHDPTGQPANVGYARVSTIDQDPALQLDALAAAGCAKVFEDRASGARADRAGLRSAFDYVRDGDVLIVWKLDRLGRSLPHLIETVATLEKRGVGSRSGDRHHHAWGAACVFTCLAHVVSSSATSFRSGHVPDSPQPARKLNGREASSPRV